MRRGELVALVGDVLDVDVLAQAAVKEARVTILAHDSDSTSIGASGSGAVLYRFGGLINASILGSDGEATRGHLQQQATGSTWSQVLYPDYRQTPLAPRIDLIDLDLSQLQASAPGEN